MDDELKGIDKITWLKEKGLWEQAKRLYLEKRKNNTDYSVHAFALYIEAIEDICLQNGYYNQ